jgi:hypothetical protein
MPMKLYCGAISQRRMSAAVNECPLQSRSKRQQASALFIIQALPSPMTTLTQQDKWIRHADTHHLPVEVIPPALGPEQTGMDFNWPPDMVGKATLQMLHEKELRLTSQCIQLAGCMTNDQFQTLMQGGRPSFAYLLRTVFDVASQLSSVRDYEDRKSRWGEEACVTNINILEQWLLP